MDPVYPTSQAEISPEVLNTLVEIGEKANASLNLEEVLAQVAALIKRVVDYEIFAVLLLDKTTNQLYFRFSVGHRREVAENWRIPVGQGITGAAADTRKAILVPDVRLDPRYINALDPVQSELAVPLLYKGDCVGVLDIQSTHLDYFNHEHQAILTLLASRLAIAIENARLFEATTKYAETLLLLNEVGREASSILDVEKLLQRAVELTKHIIDYQIFSILLYDETDDAFRQRISVKYGQSVTGKFEVPARAGVIGAAVALRQPLIVPDVSADPRYIQTNPETRSELVVPMFYQNRVIGVLDLESPLLNYFTEEHAQALSILAAHLAVSLENARLYQKVARHEARMERELHAARRIQGALLPPPPTEDFGLDIAARYISARELGGDLYDFLRYGANHLGIALGDVSGKGTAAALYGAVGIGILRSLAPRKLQPAEILRELNKLVCERKIDERFMTLCFATWQAARRRLRMANAGQSQPLLWKNGRCERVKIEGFPLGIFEDATYDEWSVTLEPGDILLLYSDGVVEDMNPRGEQFGAERLAQLIEKNAGLSATKLADLILETASQFSAGAPAQDDRTLVVLKVR